MKEIASQFNKEQYDQFSRQIPVGGKGVSKPYLQRKNKAHDADNLNTEENNYGEHPWTL